MRLQRLLISAIPFALLVPAHAQGQTARSDKLADDKTARAATLNSALVVTVPCLTGH